MKTPSPLTLITALVTGMIAISFAPILVRYSDAPVSVQGMYRMLFTVILMLPWGIKYIKQIRLISVKDWLLLSVAGFFLALHFLLWMESVNYTSIASSTIILALEPVFVMIGAYFVFNDRPGKAAVIGLFIALIGACCIGSGDIGISRSAFIGDVLSLLGALAVAVNMLVAKRILSRVPSYLYSLIVFTFTFVFFAAYNFTVNIPVSGYPAKEWFVFLLLAIVPTVFGHMIFNWLLQYVKATTVSMTVFAEPVGASLLGVWLFQEYISDFQIIGGLGIIIGLVMYLRSEQQQQKSSKSTVQLEG
ncbi:DMT family transporter [Cohnella kolymensis]|uniref:DMT family transporter n=1 Tax=Cohnella kolymensis TaxID=1590652 RepID=UPI000AECB2D4|nr:DMT family transporter [Cohnella kolymensis]